MKGVSFNTACPFWQRVTSAYSLVSRCLQMFWGNFLQTNFYLGLILDWITAFCHACSYSTLDDKMLMFRHVFKPVMSYIVNIVR